MKIQVPKETLVKSLKRAQGIADKKSTMPMLANALLKVVNKDELWVAATDLNVSVTTKIKCNSEGEWGITLNAKALHDMVVNAPAEDIEISKAKNNWAEITSGHVNYRVVGTPDLDFPKIPEIEKSELVDMDPETFRDMIDKTLYSVSNDETRYHLNGVLFECDGKTGRMVSTDGHRLSKVERPLSGALKLSAGVIIPKKGLIEIRKGLENQQSCQMAIKSPYMFLETKDTTLVVKLIESQFPPYQQVIPEGNNKIVVVEKGAFTAALKRASLMSSETRGVRVHVADKNIQISSDNPDIGEVKENLPSDYSGDALTIGFNPKYILDMLAQVKEEKVELALSTELDPVLVRPQGDDAYLGVVMPMRI